MLRRSSEFLLSSMESIVQKNLNGASESKKRSIYRHFAIKQKEKGIMTKLGKKRRRQLRIRRQMVLVLITAVITTVTVLVTGVSIKTKAQEESAQTASISVARHEMAIEPMQFVQKMPLYKAETADEESEVNEDEPQENKSSVFEQECLHEEIPLDYELQRHLMDVCEEYKVPHHIALGVIQAESSFIADASNGTCFGYMQINRTNADWLSESIGVTDLTDPYQNISSGVFILSNLFEDYGDWNKALIAYNYGPAGAQKHIFSKGYTTTGYSRAVMAYAEDWFDVVGK